MNIKFLIKTSRPKFWAYTFGTYLVGYFAGLKSADITQLTNPKFILLLIFFTFFANLFIYGVNDISDRDTDKHNIKKKKHENLLKKKDEGLLKRSLVFTIILSVLIMIVIPETRFWIIMFLILGGAYSLPPFRLKKRPFLDSISNIFYVFPAFGGYLLTQDSIPNFHSIVYFLFFPVAMHLYSAIPDIEADSKAKLKTSAVVFGPTASLVICNVLWLIFALGIINFGVYFPWTLVLLVYPILPLLNLNMKSFPVSKTYWYLPLINFVLGFGFSMLIIFNLYE